jgi:predicted nucleic acid-binding Zn ribbon protein
MTNDMTNNSTPPEITPEELAAATERSLRRVVKGGPKRARKKSDRSGRDPELLGNAIDKLVIEQGWQHDSAVAALSTRWNEIVGPEVATHTRPGEFHEGTLRIHAESTAWATQLKLLTGTILTKIAAEIGPDVVTTLVITGPQAPSWKKGGWRVAGRGPRDTYG